MASLGFWTFQKKHRKYEHDSKKWPFWWFVIAPLEKEVSGLLDGPMSSAILSWKHLGRSTCWYPSPSCDMTCPLCKQHWLEVDCPRRFPLSMLLRLIFVSTCPGKVCFLTMLGPSRYICEWYTSMHTSLFIWILKNRLFEVLCFQSFNSKLRFEL